MGNGIPITCTTTYQKWTGQPIHLAGSKNPLSSDMGSVKVPDFSGFIQRLDEYQQWCEMT